MKPAFANPIFEELYKKDFFIDKSVLSDIIQMESKAIPELEKIVADKIETFAQYEQEDWFANFSLIHALYLLYELDAEESLPLLLRIAAQKKDFLEYWFSDHLHEDLPELIAKLGRNQSKACQEFVQNPAHPLYNRNIVNQALMLIGAVYPEKREEVVIFFREHLRQFIDQSSDIEKVYPADEEDDSIYEYISFLVADLQLYNYRELEDEIRLCYQKRLVDEFMVGTEDSVEFESKEVTLTRGITEKYQAFKEWLGEYSPYHPEAARIAVERQQQEDKVRKELAAWQKRQQKEPAPANVVPVNSAPKINRNDPCPCGSGKKYKKCCME